MSSGTMARNHRLLLPAQLSTALHRTHLVAPHKGVALPRNLHVLIPIQHDAHGAAQVVGRDGAGGVEEAGARLLAAKAAACMWRQAGKQMGIGGCSEGGIGGRSKGA